MTEIYHQVNRKLQSHLGVTLVADYAKKRDILLRVWH